MGKELPADQLAEVVVPADLSHPAPLAATVEDPGAVRAELRLVVS